MKLNTATRMKEAINPFRGELFRNEWDGIIEHIDFYVEKEGIDTEKVIDTNNLKKEKDKPMLKALWDILWNKKTELSWAVIVVIFGAGALFGKYLI